MKAERVLVIATGILLSAVVGFCWNAAHTPQSYDSSGTELAIPWAIVWGQLAYTGAAVFAIVGLASAAGLLFLRAARWDARSDVETEPTPESSP